MLFALLSSAPVLHAAETTAHARKATNRTTPARTETGSRAHPVMEKSAHSAGSSTTRLTHVPDHTAAVRSDRSSETRLEASSHHHSSFAEPAAKTRGGHVVAAKEEERESRGKPRLENRREVAEVVETRSRKIASAGRTAHIEPARTATAGILRSAQDDGVKRTVIATTAKPVEVENAAPPASAIESDPEAASLFHDRKVHHAANDDAEPRKATATDFLNGTSKPAETTPVPPPLPKPVAAAIKRAKVVPVPPIVIAKATLDLEPSVSAPVVYRRGRLVIPPALKGSHEILVHQNEMANFDGLERIRDDYDLDDMRESKLLVAIPAVQGMQVDERLPANRRYCRPWTAEFLTALARAHYARFHTALQVNSAVRTVEFQQRLIMTNGNAAPAEGETASPHLTGQAVDLAKHGLSMTEIAWLRGYLLPLVQQGKVDVEEEFQQACFHVSVYRKYTPQPAPKREIVAHRAGATALATALP